MSSVIWEITRKISAIFHLLKINPTFPTKLLLSDTTEMHEEVVNIGIWNAV